MQTQDMINQVANAIVAALIERLTSDETFISKLSEKVVTTRTLREEQVSEMIREHMSELEAENVGGLEEFVDNAIDSKLDGLEVDSDNVNGLDNAIESAVESAIDNMEKESVEADDIIGLEKEIENVVDRKIDDMQKSLKEEVNQILLEDVSLQHTISKFVADTLRSQSDPTGMRTES